METIKSKFALFLVSVFLTGFFNTQAQKRYESDSYEYKNAVGLRIGSTSGLTYKHRFDDRNALELILGTFPYSYGLTGLYERYIPTKTEGLYLYAGGGMHFGRSYKRAWGYYYNERYYQNRYYVDGPVVGIDLIGGIEYKIPSVPLSLSFDLKPYAEFFRGYGPYYNLDPGLGVKFSF
jgi:hypothetical protein